MAVLTLNVGDRVLVTVREGVEESGEIRDVRADGALVALGRGREVFAGADEVRRAFAAEERVGLEPLSGVAPLAAVVIGEGPQTFRDAEGVAYLVRVDWSEQQCECRNCVFRRESELHEPGCFMKAGVAIVGSGRLSVHTNAPRVDFGVTERGDRVEPPLPRFTVYREGSGYVVHDATRSRVLARVDDQADAAIVCSALNERERAVETVLAGRIRTPQRAEFLRDVAITAAEGGVNYWGGVVAYDPDAGTFRVEETDGMGGGDGPVHTVDGDLIERGIARLAVPGVQCAADIRGWVLRGSATNDAGEIDADAADVIVQVGLFGEIVYG